MLNIPITEAACSDDAASDYMSVDSDDVNFIASETEILKDAESAAKLQKKENEAFLESETISEESDPMSIDHFLYDDVDDAEKVFYNGTKESNDSQSLYLSPVESPPVETPLVENPSVENQLVEKDLVKTTQGEIIFDAKSFTHDIESHEIKVNKSDIPFEILQSMRDVWKKVYAQKLSKIDATPIYNATFEEWRVTFSETLYFTSYESLQSMEQNYVDSLIKFCQNFFKRRINRWNGQTTSQACVENYLITNMKKSIFCKFSQINFPEQFENLMSKDDLKKMWKSFCKTYKKFFVVESHKSEPLVLDNYLLQLLQKKSKESRRKT